MSRTITKTAALRLEAQAEEAKLLKLDKLAGHLERLAKNEVRSNDESYSYTHEQMRTDVERAIWDGLVRAADYFGAPFDGMRAQQAVEKLAEDLIYEARVIVGNESGVGPNDVPVPGQVIERVAFELEVNED